MKLEFIIQNAEEAQRAEALGADRLELVSAIELGGLTPSYGTIKQVLKSVSIPVHIMIRPHPYHYHYGQEEMDAIIYDVQQILALGGDRIVFGALQQNGSIDLLAIERILSLSKNLQMTFHRAFDQTTSLMDAYHTLLPYQNQITTILTSGGAPSVSKGKETLNKLVKRSQDVQGPEIMPGGGLTIDHFHHIHQLINANIYHFGKAVRLGHTFEQSFDPHAVTELKKIARIK